MNTWLRRATMVIVALIVSTSSLSAQALRDTNTGTLAAQRTVIESTLETVVAVLQETTFQRESGALSERLREIAQRLSNATHYLAPTDKTASAALSPDDLDRLNALLLDVIEQIQALRTDLEAEQSYEVADRLMPIEESLTEATEIVRRLDEEDATDDTTVRVADGSRWLEPGDYDDTRDTPRRSERTERDDEDDEYDDWDDHAHRRGPFDGWDHWDYAGTFVGEFSSRWPFRQETALYRPIPAIRYNRVEGLVLGAGRRPLQWDEYDNSRLYGQIGYAFALEDVRFTVGAETRLDRGSYRNYGLKLGGNYHFNTTTNDLWKTSWLENSLAAFFFENDFFDYYEVEGWTIYAAQRFTPYVQLSAGFRADDYRSLEQATSWSLFDGDGFFVNPPIEEGYMNSFVFALEGGRVRGLHHLPRGGALRAEAELGRSLGGDFSFNRYLADGRVYLPVTPFSSLGLRLRGAYATDDAPIQKQFTLGGLGSVRSYQQNGFVGTRMLLGNVEYVIDDVSLFDDVFDDVQLLGLFDAGWVNAFGTNEFSVDDVLPSAGVGVGFDDRAVRLELTWPLRDLGGGRDASLWLRISPSF